MRVMVFVFLLLLLPMVFSPYIFDQNKVGIVGGAKVTSYSYEMQIATGQGLVGESSSDDYNVQVGWIYTLLAGKPLIITVYVPVVDANINSNPTISFDVNKNTLSDVNNETIFVDLNGAVSTDFDYLIDCIEFSGSFYCSYVETELVQNADANVSFRATNDANEQANQVDRIVHFDIIAPVIDSLSVSASGNDIIVTFEASDSFTGVEAFYVKEDGENWIRTNRGSRQGQGKIWRKNYQFSGKASASHTYQVKAKDFADNNSLISEVSYSPPTPPTPPSPVQPGAGSGLTPLEEGEFEIIIVRIDYPVEVGEKFDFTYILINNTSSAGNAYVEYWLEKDGKKIVSGSETIYLQAGEQKEINENLLLTGEMDGDYQFKLMMTREGQDPITLERPSRIMLGAPTVIELGFVSLEASYETEPLAFSITVSSNSDEILPVLIEEKIYKEGKIVWVKEQTVPIEVFQRFFEEIYGLEAGEYVLEITATYGDIEERVEKTFEIKPGSEPIPGVPFLPELISISSLFFDSLLWIILILIVIAILLLIKRYLKRKKRKGWTPVGKDLKIWK